MTARVRGMSGEHGDGGGGRQESPSLSSDCRLLSPWRPVRISVLCEHSVRVGAGPRATAEEEGHIISPGPTKDAEWRPYRIEMASSKSLPAAHAVCGARGPNREGWTRGERFCTPRERLVNLQEDTLADLEVKLLLLLLLAKRLV